MNGRVVFFDIGNTLVQSGLLSPRRVLFARLNLSEQETKRVGRLIMTFPGESPSELAKVISPLLPGRDPDWVADVLAAVWAEQIRDATQIPGAVAVLRGLKELGFRLGVLSNAWHPSYLGFRKACPDVLDLLDFEILSYRKRFKKPSPELFMEAIRAAGVPPWRCWMVGDTYELDVEPARRLGVNSVWVLSHPEKEVDALALLLRGERPLPDFTAGHIGEILPYFEGVIH